MNIQIQICVTRANVSASGFLSSVQRASQREESNHNLSPKVNPRLITPAPTYGDGGLPTVEADLVFFQWRLPVPTPGKVVELLS
jgi:hypothetical protein